MWQPVKEHFVYWGDLPEHITSVCLICVGQTEAHNKLYVIRVEYENAPTEFLTVTSSKPYPRTRWTKVYAKQNAEKWINEQNYAIS